MQENITKETDGILYIAEIPYETGEIHFRYSRKLSADGIKWIRHGRFAEYYQNGKTAAEGYYSKGNESGTWHYYMTVLFCHFYTSFTIEKLQIL